MIPAQNIVAWGNLEHADDFGLDPRISIRARGV